MKTPLFFAFLSLSNIVSAQPISIGARSIALNSQQALVAEAAGTIFFNPSILLEQPHHSVWLHHHKPYNIAEIDVYAIAANYSRKAFVFGAGYLEFGNKIYQDQFFSLAGAYRVGAKLSVGLKYTLRRISIKEYGSSNNSALDFGLHIPFSKNISLGLLIKNAASGKISKMEERRRREVRTALRIKLPQYGAFYAEITQEAHFDTELRFGVEYFLFENLPVRFGTGINSPESFAAGFGIRYAHFQLNYALQNHPALDQSHIFTLTITGR